MDLTTVLDKLLLPLALLAGQLWLNAKFKSAEDKRDAARADTDAKRKAEAEWRSSAVGQVNVSTSGVITGFNFGASSSYWGFLLSYPVD